MLKIRIRIRVKSRTKIRIQVKRWIRNRIKFKIQELWRLKIEPCKAVDAHNRGLKWSHGGPACQWSQACITLMRSMGAGFGSAPKGKVGFRIRIRVKGKRQISIHIYNTVQCAASTASEGHWFERWKRQLKICVSSSVWLLSYLPPFTRGT